MFYTNADYTPEQLYANNASLGGSLLVEIGNEFLYTDDSSILDFTGQYTTKEVELKLRKTIYKALAFIWVSNPLAKNIKVEGNQLNPKNRYSIIIISSGDDQETQNKIIKMIKES